MVWMKIFLRINMTAPKVGQLGLIDAIRQQDHHFCSSAHVQQFQRHVPKICPGSIRMSRPPPPPIQETCCRTCRSEVCKCVWCVVAIELIELVEGVNVAGSWGSGKEV